jgi:GT2 family glycosyltransferase
MDLTIVIVNWNTCDMLRDCLSSVYANLGCLRTEVIVVDNASSDGSPLMVEKEFPKVKLIVNDDNLGFAAANNQALPLASGKYVLLLNSDTVVHGSVLESSFKYMEKRGDVGVLGCRVLNADGTIQKTCGRFPTLKDLMLHTSGIPFLTSLEAFDCHLMLSWNREDDRNVDVVSGCYMFVRAAAMAEVGDLDDSFFFFGEETDWCRRFKTAGLSVRFAPVGNITHYGGGSSGSLNHRRDLMLTASLVRLHNKHFSSVSGAMVWLVLLAFNLSRAGYWSVRSSVDRGPRAIERRRHFLAILGNYASVWRTARARVKGFA